MPQFTVHKNKDPKSKSRVPYLLDVQNDLLSELTTRVVIPLYIKRSTAFKPITTLTPELSVEGKKYLLMTPQLAGIAIENLGEAVADLSKHRGEIIGAVDLLITGF